MIVNYASWYKAIFERYSVRNYNGNPLKKDDKLKLEDICSRFTPFPGVRAVLINEKSDDIYKGIIGSYGKIKGAPAYIAFIGDLSFDNVYEVVGYIGEGIILEATAIGLGTCWIGGTFKPSIVQRHTELKENERVFAITPVGYPAKELTFDQRLIFKLVKKGRKPLEEICYFTLEDNWIKDAVDAARLAPSAVNRQPWRFEKEGEDNIIIKMDKYTGRNELSKRLDCGIAMLHLELGAYEQSIKGQWEFLESPYVARFKASRI